VSASPNERSCIYAGAHAMTDLVERIRKELDARIDQLRPLVGEFERLQRAAAALARAGTRAVPARGPHKPAPPAARPTRQRTDSSRAAKPAARKPAPRGQTQAKVLAALRATPGSTAATVAKASGTPTNTAAATISRLVKQGRVRRLEPGRYAVVETPDGPVPAAPDTTPAAGDSPDAQAPATTETPTAQ
jgi:hypothetical protein